MKKEINETNTKSNNITNNAKDVNSLKVVIPKEQKNKVEVSNKKPNNDSTISEPNKDNNLKQTKVKTTPASNNKDSIIVDEPKVNEDVNSSQVITKEAQKNNSKNVKKIFKWANEWALFSKETFPLMFNSLVKFLTELGYDLKKPRCIYFYYDPYTNLIHQFDSNNNVLSFKLDCSINELLEVKTYHDAFLYRPRDEKVGKVFSINPKTSAIILEFNPSGRKNIDSMSFNLLDDNDINELHELTLIEETKSIDLSVFPIAGFIFDLSVPIISRLSKSFLIEYGHEITHNIESLVRNREEYDELKISKDVVFANNVKKMLVNDCDVELINAISSNNYERKECRGTVQFSNNKGNVTFSVLFEKQYPFTLNNLRAIRKIVEISDTKNHIIVIKKKIYGLGISNVNNKIISFIGEQKWSLSQGDEVLLKFSRGKYLIPNKSISYFPTDIFTNEKTKKFANDQLMETIRKMTHGALLLLSDKENIIKEVDRLTSLERGYKITPIKLMEKNQKGELNNLNLLVNLASIDGAMFFDFDFTCYGIGIILDGIAKNIGTSARGSRFNSANCYLDNKDFKKNGKWIGVVVSEDESVDILKNY
jgi:hypothetical protein